MFNPFKFIKNIEEISKARIDATEMQRKLNNASTNIDTIYAKLNELKLLIESTAKDNESLVNEATNQVSDLGKELESTTDEFHELKDSWEEFKEAMPDVDSMKSDLENIEGRVDDMENEAITKDNIEESVSEIKDELHDDIGAIEAQVDELKALIERFINPPRIPLYVRVRASAYRR
jgi:chromosome segregation ATPase